MADGLTVPAPLPEAFAKVTGVDVPFIVSSMAQEAGRGPRDDVTGMSSPQFTHFLSNKFAAWGPGLGHSLAALYREEISESVQKAYDTIAADQGMTCGNHAVAIAAAQGFQSPVYSMYNEAYNTTESPATWAYHGYDLKLASKVASPVGARLRALWYEFAATGAIASWTPVVARMQAAGNTTTMRFLPEGFWRAAASWRSDVCTFWKRHGAGPQFWWSN